MVYTPGLCEGDDGKPSLEVAAYIACMMPPRPAQRIAVTRACNQFWDAGLIERYHLGNNARGWAHRRSRHEHRER
jgi:hypothetical protein